MGVSLQVYAGPLYLVPKRDIPVTTKVRVCSNTDTCGKPAASRQDKFCPLCGSPIVEQKVPGVEHRYPTPDDLDGDWTDLMTTGRLPDGREVWYPNHRGFGTNLAASNGGMKLFDRKTADEELAKFRSYHSKIFNAFHAKFGVELNEAYGVIAYEW